MKVTCTRDKPTKAKHGQAKRRGRGEPKTSARLVKATVREAAAVRLRIQGKSLQEIADELGYEDPTGPYHAIIRCLAKTQQEPAEELRAIHRQRLAILLRVLWAEIGEEREGLPSIACPYCEKVLPIESMKAIVAWLDTKHDAIDRILKVLQREARLEGLDIQGSDEKPEVHRFIVEVSEMNGNNGGDPTPGQA